MQLTDRDFLLNESTKQVDYSLLLSLMKSWIEAESLPFKMGVLATIDEKGHPMSRTVAIREINQRGLLFFTQLGSAKVAQLTNNPHISFTFMLPNTQRQITVLGNVTPLGESEKEKYWETYDQERRLRFLVYGTKSGQKIKNQKALDKELVALKAYYKDVLPARPKEYIGYMIIPEEIKFYQLNEHRLSDSLSAKKNQQNWNLQRFVP